jgi:hypothetical protein
VGTGSTTTSLTAHGTGTWYIIGPGTTIVHISANPRVRDVLADRPREVDADWRTREVEAFV